MKKTKEKAISLRLSQELYQKFVNKAISKSNNEKRIINVSEIIREVLEKGV